MALIFNKKKIDPNDTMLPTENSVAEQYDNMKERSQELMPRQAKNYLDEKEKNQYGDPNIASRDPYADADTKTYGEAGSEMGRQNIHQDLTSGLDSTDVNQNALGQISEGFMRGIGDTIKSVGNVINFPQAAWANDLEGNILGRALENWGDSITDNHMTALKKSLEGKEFQWSDMTNPDYWTTHMSEMIPTLLAFAATGGLGEVAGEAVGEATAGMFTKFGSKAYLDTSLKQMGEGALSKLGGVEAKEAAYELAGTGKGLTGKLLKNTEGIASLTDTGKAFSKMVGAGVTNNMIMGAQLGMSTYKQMDATNKQLQSEGKEPLYSEKDMGDAAAGAFINNIASLPIDIASWGITFGKLPEKAMASFTKGSAIKTSEQIIADASKNVSKGLFPLVQGLGKIAGHGLYQGTVGAIEMSFQQFASKQAMEKKVGVGATYGSGSEFYDYFMSKESESVRTDGFAMGALMGGFANLKGAFNKHAQDAIDYHDSTMLLKKAYDATDERASIAKEFHINQVMLDLHNKGRQDLFEKVMDSMIADGSISPELAVEHHEKFIEVGKAFEKADSLNIAGKQALMNEVISGMSAKKTLEANKIRFEEKIKYIKDEFGDTPESQKMIEEITKDQKQSDDIMNVKLAFSEQNKLNIISGKLADPAEMIFITSKDGKERAMFPKYMTHTDFEIASEKGGLIGSDGNGGLSTDQVEKWVEMDDEQVYAHAQKMLKNAIGSMPKKTRTIFDRLLGRNKDKEPVAEDKLGDVLNENDSDVKEPVKTEKEPEMTSDEVKTKKEELDTLLTDKEVKINPVLKKEDSVTQDEHPTDGGTTTPMTEEEWRKTPNGIQATKIEEELKANEEAIKRNNDVEEANRPKGPDLNNDGTTINGDIRKANENDFEKQLIDSKEDIESKGKSKEEIIEEKNKASEKEYIEADQKEIDSEPYDEDRPKPYSIKEENSVFKVHDINGDVLKAGSKERIFQTKEQAQRAIDRVKNDDTKNNVKPRGKAFVVAAVATAGSVVGVAKVRKGIKDRIQARKDANDPVKIEEAKAKEKKAKEESDRKRTLFQQEYNAKRDAVRRNIVQKMYNDKVNANNGNPTVSIKRDELDAYLDSSIAKFQRGPSDVMKQTVINRALKAKGIKINLVDLNNLLTHVGTNAMGYVLASNIFIDSQSMDQPHIFMHEIAHVNYRITKNEAPTMAIVKRAQNNTELVKRIKNDYREHVLYDIEDGNEIKRKSLLDTLIEQGMGYDEAMSNITFHLDDVLFGLDNPKESPMEFQDTINEELFTNELQGPLSEHYSMLFNKTKEFGRTKVSKAWLSWLKGKENTTEESTLDVVNSLNNGKNVPKQDLYEHVMKGLVDNLQKESATTRGFASKVSMANAEEIASKKRISSDKLSEQKSYEFSDRMRANKKSLADETIEKIKSEIKNIPGISEAQRDVIMNYALQDFEDKMMDIGAFDDTDLIKDQNYKGASSILNNFAKSMNYVKRVRHALNPDNIASNFDVTKLVDRDELISEINNLAFETKGDTNKFIHSIENSPVHEIAMFNKYMDTMFPGKKNMMLSSMSYVLGNTQTIPAVRDFVTTDGRYEIINALSETEKNKVDSHMKYLQKEAQTHFHASPDEVKREMYDNFFNSVKRIKNDTQTRQDYLNVLKALTPMGVKYYELVKSNSISLRGSNESIEFLVKNLVKKAGIIREKDGSIDVSKLRPFVEAVVDSNRKYTSYSVIQQADGNFTASKIGNNHLLDQNNQMINFLSTKKNGKFPSFQAFKEQFGHIINPKLRTQENPVLKNIYDNFMNDKGIPSITQYVGMENQQSQKTVMYKDSTDFTETVSDFLKFSNPNRANSDQYLQTLGAMADSPRKFYTSVKRLKYDDHFNTKGVLDKTGKLELLTQAGERQLKNAFDIYFSLNKNLTEKEKVDTYQDYSSFKDAFRKELRNEINKWETFGKDLHKNKSIGQRVDNKFENFFNEDGRMTENGKKKIAEFVFNQSINGLAASEIYNPGIPVKDIVKRNKGNSSPVMSTGNPNLRIEAIPINDGKYIDSQGKTVDSVKKSTDGGMYMLKEDADKLVNLGKGVFDQDGNLKILNYHIERNNLNFKGRAAYFKGNTTVISAETLISEPGLKGIHELLTQRRELAHARYEERQNKKYSNDLLNYEENYLNIAIPHSAVKSEFYTPEQLEMLKEMTFANLNEEYNNPELNASNRFQKHNDLLDKLYYDEKGSFVGLSGENFGPQQVLGQEVKQSPTAVQFISSLIVNGETQGTLGTGEEIQRLIRSDMSKNLDDILNELGDMQPHEYKNFILKSLDLENMDQGQRAKIEQSLTNLNHPFIADFVNNTLANRLKYAANKLKTAGTISVLKPDLHYRLPNGYSVEGSNGFRLKGYTDLINGDGSKGTHALEIVLPKHMAGDLHLGGTTKPEVQARTYLVNGSEELKEMLKGNKSLSERYEKGTSEDKLDVIKSLAKQEAGRRFVKRNIDEIDDIDKVDDNILDKIGSVQKGGETIGYFVRGENVSGTRIPSHGPASTGVFEVIDYLKGEGNHAIIHHDVMDVMGADYDGDSLFIQRKSKDTPGFNKALDKTSQLWSSPEMYAQIRSKIDFEDKVNSIIKDSGIETKANFPMSPSHNRQAYNDTMVSKRNIGIVFNTHRIANYLAAYEVGLNNEIRINGNEIKGFKDNKVGTDSRNNQSAMLANIILDNAKWHFADKLGLNSETVNQYSLLTNMGVDMKDVAAIMNSSAVKQWAELKRNNESPFLIKKTNAEIKEQLHASLGTDKQMTASLHIDTKNLEDPQQKRNIIHLMDHLEAMNKDLLKISKIMAGHNGIENNPFILERQIKEFNDVIDAKPSTDSNPGKGPLLNFNEGFKNNPDIKAYKENAEKVLDVMKKANNIYRESTSKLIEKLNEKMGYDGMSEKQLDRASGLIKKFITSRILGLNNISAEEKLQKKNELFTQLNDYRASMIEASDANGVTSLDKSMLFQRALNYHYDPRENNKYSYISANPRFFNESLGSVEYKMIQREFHELPKEIKDNLISLDLINNGLSGSLSLANIFDEQLDHHISTYAAFDAKNKNKAISPKVMSDLERLIVTNEMTSKDGQIPRATTKEIPKLDEMVQFLKTSDIKYIYQSMKQGKAAYFKINDIGYEFDGISKAKLAEINKSLKGNALYDALDREINDKIKIFDKANGDINLNTISIPDGNTFKPYKTYDSTNMDGKADHIVEANIIDAEKKTLSDNRESPRGMAYKMDFYNYSAERPLSQDEYEKVMEFKNPVNEFQRKALYETYQKEKEKANEIAKTVNTDTVRAMSYDKLDSLYKDYSNKDMYAYSIVSTPVTIEMLNRESNDQSKLTGKYEDGKDIPLMSSWFDNNNIGANHPATQAIVRKVNEEYKKFVKARGEYVQKINDVTEALYKEKFNLSDNKYIALAQKVYQSIFNDRSDVYNNLYGNLVETNTIKLTDGKTRKEFKFKTKEEINSLYNSGKISDAEKNFYDTFRATTEHLSQFDENINKRKDYIPHTAMNSMEMYSTRGLLGIFVNSRGIEEGINDVKVYQNQNGVKTLISFNDVKNNFNAMALKGDNGIGKIVEFNRIKRTAKRLLKEGKNEDGTDMQYSHMQNATLMDMSPMSRFSSSRSLKAEEMPSMDLNKALIDYVHASLFTNGNDKFQGFKKMMPLVDGALAYNDKMGYKNAYNYTKEVIKDGFMLKRNQDLFGPTGDKVINGMVQANTFYALGYKGLILGQGLYAVGNVAIGKYMNIKREGLKSWSTGEQRYWGTDKGANIDGLSRSRRAKNILNTLGFMEADLHDDVSIETKSGLDSIFGNLALMPMAKTENWIQKVHFLGLLTPEEFDKFDTVGKYKDGETQIPQERILALEERVKLAQGKGYSPTDQSRIQKYSLGKAFMQFSRHIPAQIRERFAKEDVDVYGNKHIGSLRQMYLTCATIASNGMTPDKFKEYYKTLKPHEQEALKSGMRGMAMMGMFGMISASLPDSSNKLSADNISRGAISDANVQFSPDRMSFKLIPPVIRSTMAITNTIFNGGSKESKTPNQ